MTWNIDELVAIDMHVHVEQDAHGCCSLDQELIDAASHDLGSEERRMTCVRRHRLQIVNNRSRVQHRIRVRCAIHLACVKQGGNQ